jgi:hypothetical protein
MMTNQEIKGHEPQKGTGQRHPLKNQKSPSTEQILDQSKFRYTTLITIIYQSTFVVLKGHNLQSIQ